MATLHGLFEQQVPKAPSKVAVQWREASLSYAELDRCADAMAGRLCREGARRGEIVGLMLDRSLEMVVAIIGCLKSGAAYVTLLPTWPAQQRLEILREAESRILILQSSFHEDLAAFDGAKLTFDDCRLSEPSTSRVPVEATDLAYIIYTSGSTGKPKGVMMHHGGTANNIACNAHLSCSEASRCCFSNKYSFDVHVADIFKPLSVGATVVVTRDIFRIPPVDVVSTLPNKIAMAKVPKSLRTIIFTGEGITEACIRPVPVTTQVLNIYGATEFFDATLKRIDRSTFPARIQSMGKPLGDYVQLWVMDPETRQQKPCEEPGELVVGGFQVAKGYIKRPELTAFKFFPDPWTASPAYRTGDLVRCCQDGEFEYLGRVEHRVEVRGTRIDLSSVEDALAAVPGVTSAAAVVRGDPPRLLAYVSPRAAQAEAQEAARSMRHLAPDVIIAVEEWPRTSSGKIDKNRLHELDATGVLAGSEGSSPKAKRAQRMFHDEVTDETGPGNESDVDADVDADFQGVARCQELARFAVEQAALCDGLPRAVQVQAYRTGLVVFNQALPGTPELPPLSLVPSPVPSGQLQHLQLLAPIFSRLVDRVSCDLRWLTKCLAPVSDPWLCRLLGMAQEVYGPGGKDPAAQPRLLLMRQDYLLGGDGRYRQVEINTIAVAFAGFTEQLSLVHQHTLAEAKLALSDAWPLEDNTPSTDYAAALAAAHNEYMKRFGSDNGHAPRVCFYCFPDDFLEMDQCHIESALRRLKVPTFRAFLGAKVTLGDASTGGTLLIDGVEASVVFLHCTFCPEHFAHEGEWHSRKLMELSRAIKVPSLLGHLAGAKRVQQALSRWEELSRFLPPEDAGRCMSVFVAQYDPSQPASAGAVENALERPERWVLKPQREGGGNNFFGAALAEQLRGNDLSQFVLMEKIVSPSMPAMLLKAGVATSVEAVSELGIFSAHLAVDHEILSTVGGAMLRTKASSSEEGGVCAGHGAIDTPLVVSEVGGQGGAHAGQIPAEKCLLLVCGLPGSGKTQFCKALADSAAKFFLVTTWHHLSYDSPSRTERETISNRVDALLTAPGSAAILLDDNMYSSITRAHWAQVAIDKNCAFHQLFLKAPLDLCLERNSLRPSAVPDFSIRYMAEVFEWPQDGTWEGQHSMMLNAQETASQQVDSFLHHLPAAKFWERVRPPDTALPRKDAHNMDLDLRKIVSLALKDAKLPKLAMPVLAKQWSTRKAALVAESQAKASAADTSALRHEMVETFLRSCMADVSAASAASPSKQDGPDKDLDKEEVSVLGPPFRWLPAECGCYFTDNIYARLVDAYFKVLNPEMEAAEFWKVNDREYDAATRSQIFAEAVNTAKRRKEAPQVFRKNLSTVLKQYRPKHPELFLRKADVRVPFPPSQAAEVFKSGFLEIWEQARGGKELGAKHVHDSCHECPFLSDAFVEQLKAELRHFKEQKLPHQQPNSMNRNGCILNEIGLGPLMDRMIYVYLMPVCRALYPDLLPGVDSHHSFIVEYGPNMDTNLGVHDDNSEVTINVSLSQDYSGGELVLYHRARVAHPQKLEKKPYYHRTTHGTMLLHPGELLHEVLPVTAGNRQGLIIWLRSDAFRKKHGCPLCQSTDRLLYA
ncbi:unnamed protein product [Effrenium voratum]|uniref:glutathione synthase n=2 Tax=Effrenium voratum TaxID=2562239 RepID=A0AA36MK77_9DINO|nr:unnamed protein product [Effrenium voratum]CAJ1444280.1 unnamed protein product [Effrenium voratum]